jgi:dCTP deaminase
MALLCDHEIEKLVEGLEIITPYSQSQLNPASYDITLGHTLLVETPGPWQRLRDRRLRRAMPYNDRWLVVDISETTEQHPYLLRPGDFVLGCTDEVVNLPAWLSAQFVLKSSVARRGYEHSEAGWIDGGFNGRVTLELSNILRRHKLPLWKGMRIGQLKFFRTTVPRNPYGSTESSHYQHSWGVRPSWEEERW